MARRAVRHDEAARRAVSRELRPVHERPPGPRTPRLGALRPRRDRGGAQLREEDILVHSRGARGDDRGVDRRAEECHGDPLLRAPRRLRAEDRRAGDHPRPARGERLRVRVPDGAHEPPARAGRRDRVPHAEPGVHVPELDAGEGGRAPRWPHQGTRPAARRAPAEGAPPRRRARGGESPVSRALDRIRKLASASPRRLLLAEAADPRVVGAAARIAREGLAKVALVGVPDEARATARKADVTPGAVELLDARDAALVARTRAALATARGSRLGESDLARYAADPVFQAAMLVKEGEADTYVAGAVRTTADVLRAALWLIGLAPGVKSVSSFFLMILPSGRVGAGGPDSERVLTFADCGVLP